MLGALASVFYGIATNGGTLAYQKVAPTREAADKLLNERLTAPFPADANDVLYQWESSRDYNASSQLELIKAALLAINSADDERNPPETGIIESNLKRIKNARLLLIPASEDNARPCDYLLREVLEARASTLAVNPTAAVNAGLTPRDHMLRSVTRGLLGQGLTKNRAG